MAICNSIYIFVKGIKDLSFDKYVRVYFLRHSKSVKNVDIFRKELYPVQRKGG